MTPLTAEELSRFCKALCDRLKEEGVHYVLTFSANKPEWEKESVNISAASGHGMEILLLASHNFAGLKKLGLQVLEGGGQNEDDSSRQ